MLKVIASTFGYLSMFCIALPVRAVLRTTAASVTFVASHRPISMVQAERQNSKSEVELPYTTRFRDFALVQAGRQSTAARQMVAAYSELPSALLELSFGIVFSFSQFVVFAIYCSVLKVLAIPGMRRLTASAISKTDAVEPLVAFAKSHGFVEALEFRNQGTALHAALQN